MNAEQFGELEKKVDALLAAFLVLKGENTQLREENGKLLEERSRLKLRLDDILLKLDGI